MPARSGSAHTSPLSLGLVFSHLLLDMGDLLPVFGGGAAQGEHNLTPGVEPKIVQTGDWEEEHHKDESIMNNNML